MVFKKNMCQNSLGRIALANYLSKIWRNFCQLCQMPKNWLRRMCDVLKIDFLNFYRPISGITGHPPENQKNLVLEFFIVSWMQKFFFEYLVPFSNESVKTSAGCTSAGGTKKKVT
jgi:hypothetical protein